MKINCGQCRAVYSIDDSLVTSGGVKAQCPACGHIEVVRKDAAGAQAVESSDPFAAPQFQSRPAPGSGDTIDQVFAVQPPGAPAQALTPGSSPPPLPEAAAAVPGMTGSEVPAAAVADRPGRAQSRCERCGSVIPPGAGEMDLCQRCRELERQDKALATEERQWRVRRGDGVILGPLTLAEVKRKYHENEITAQSHVARGEGDFKLISSFAEFSEFFQRPGAAFDMTFKHTPPSKAGKYIAVVAVLLVVGGGAAAWFFWPFGQGEDTTAVDVLDDALESFAREIGTPRGSAAEALASGRKFTLLDDRLSYSQADKAFKTALLIEPDNIAAMAGWVQNRALMDRGAEDVTSRKLALDLIDYALVRQPEDSRLLRAKAFLYYSLDRPEEARPLAEKALGITSGDPESQLILGATYLESSTDMAISMIEKALETEPQLNVAYRLLGEGHIRQGRFRRALKLFQDRLEKDPGNFEALAASARIYQEVGHFSRAKETYELILAATPHRPEALVAISRLYTQVFNQPRTAVTLLEKSLEEAGDMAPADRARLLTEISVALRVQGSARRASEVVAQALKEDPISVPALYARAVLEQEADKLESALVHLRDLQAHLPQMARLRARIAEAETLIPNYQKAVQQLKVAVDLDPWDLDIHLMMAVFHIYLDSPTQSYAWLQKSMAQDPFHDVNHQRLTAYYDGPDFLGLTVKRAVQAATKYPEDPLIQALCGIVLLRAGKLDQARFKLRAALELDGECFQANAYMGVLYLVEDKPSKAIPYLEAAHEADSLHHMTTKLLGLAYLRKGTAKRAKALFDEVLAAAPGDLGAHLAMGELWLKLNKKTRAAKEFSRVYQSDSDNLVAKRALFNLGH